jgi:hypothetical protein
LWYSRGYQKFVDVEASVTTKVKGFSMWVFILHIQFKMITV